MVDLRGLHRKFQVRRIDRSDEPGGKHADCNYFVLDLDHDPFAMAALGAYAEACARERPALSRDLLSIVDGNKLMPFRTQT